jgi:hypothetical protein
MFELINISPNPFIGINRRTANLIITSTRRGKVTIGGMVIYDYTPYYTIYSEMCGYYFRNFNYFLNRAPEIRNMSIGNAVIHLLKTGKF